MEYYQLSNELKEIKVAYAKKKSDLEFQKSLNNKIVEMNKESFKQEAKKYSDLQKQFEEAVKKKFEAL